jgi:hypothetical protein
MCGLASGSVGGSLQDTNGFDIPDFPLRESREWHRACFTPSMCRRVQCETCQKPSYSGCGRHVDQVLKNVAESDRCQCRATNGAMRSARPSAVGFLEPMLQTSAA